MSPLLSESRITRMTRIARIFELDVLYFFCAGQRSPFIRNFWINRPFVCDLCVIRDSVKIAVSQNSKLVIFQIALYWL